MSCSALLALAACAEAALASANDRVQDHIFDLKSEIMQNMHEHRQLLQFDIRLLIDDMKSAVSSKISEITDDLWGPTTNLGQMMEASAAVEAAGVRAGGAVAAAGGGFWRPARF